MATPILHNRLRRSSAGRVRRAGFVLEPTGARPHYTLKLSQATSDDLRRLQQTFQPPSPTLAIDPETTKRSWLS